MPEDDELQPPPDLLNWLGTGSFPSSFPGEEGLRKGRSPRDGYARGWGLEFAGLTPAILADPVYQECSALAAGRSIQVLPCRLNLYLLVRYYLPHLGAGAIVEFGSYRGGSAIFLAALCQRLGLDVKVYGLDTFAGMPATETAIDAHHEGDFQDTSLEELRAYVTQCGLDQHLTFIQGRFEETAPAVLSGCGPVLLAHVDCDIASAVAYAYDAVRPHMADGGYIVFDDATSSSCLGATEVVEDLVVRRDGLNCEQIYPHFVFRIWSDYACSQTGSLEDAAEADDQRRRVPILESRLLNAVESLVRLRQDHSALRSAQTELHIQLEREAELRRQHQALETRHSELLEEHRSLQQKVSMAARSRWIVLGRMFGVGPRFR